MSLSFVLLLPLFYLITLILGLVVRLSEKATLPKGTVIAEYETPHLLSAAELGYLVDKDFGDHELLATAIFLVGKGLIDLKKHEAENPLLVARDDIKDTELKKLTDAELTVLSIVRRRKLGSVEWKNLSSALSASLGDRANFEHEVRQMLIRKGYITNKSLFSLRNVTPLMMIVSTFILILIILAASMLLYQESSNNEPGFRLLEREQNIFGLLVLGALLWLPFIYFLQSLFLVYNYAANKPLATTPVFRRHWRDVAGFQLFVRTVEFSRMDADPNPSDPVMPYAIALGFSPNLSKLTNYKDEENVQRQQSNSR